MKVCSAAAAITAALSRFVGCEASVALAEKAAGDPTKSAEVRGLWKRVGIEEELREVVFQGARSLAAPPGVEQRTAQQVSMSSLTASKRLLGVVSIAPDVARLGQPA